jgi:hypothetical protein
MNSFRSMLYALARFLGDVNAIMKGHVFGRIRRRVLGRFASRVIR